jgi:hypothetical protein
MTDTATTQPKKTRSSRRPITKTGTSAEQAILGSGAGSDQIVDPLSIISKAALPDEITEDQIDRQFNQIEEDPGIIKGSVIRTDEDLMPGVTGTPFKMKLGKDAQTAIENLNEIAAKAVPHIRKVAIKKIARFNFKLGMERLTKEKLNLIPGTSHTWMCDKKGTDFITGFDTHPEDRKRLEKLMRVDLGPQSAYWSTLVFRLEDKEHGMIMNFDDPTLGPYYEVAYFGMLGSSLIANGLQEYRNGTKPAAEWYIEDKEAEAEAKQADMTHDIEAMELFSKLSFAKRRTVAKLIGPDAGLSAWGGSDKVVSTDLWEFIKKTPVNSKTFLDMARKNDIELEVRVIAADAIKLNVVRKNKAQEYFYADVTFGPTVDHIVQRIILPQYSNIRQAITNQIKIKNH